MNLFPDPIREAFPQNAERNADGRLVLGFAATFDLPLWTCDLQQAYLQADAGGRTTYVRLKGDLADHLPDDLKDARAVSLSNVMAWTTPRVPSLASPPIHLRTRSEKRGAPLP